MVTSSQVLKIVDEIIADLSERRGLGWEWDQIDSETKKEIRQACIDIIIQNT